MKEKLQMKKIFATILFSGMMLTAASAQTKNSDSRVSDTKTETNETGFTITKIGDGVYAAIGGDDDPAESNAGFIVGNNGVVVVDTFEDVGAARDLLAEIRKVIIGLLTEEIKELERQIKRHVDQHPNLKEQNQLLQTIPGIGRRTANLLLSEIEFERYSSARSLAAQAGVTPRKRQSGTSLKQTNLSKLGNARIRRALYFPAIVAKQHNKIIKEFAERLKKNGKTPMQIVCAAMRKLLHIAFGVLKHRRAFDASLAFSA